MTGVKRHPSFQAWRQHWFAKDAWARFCSGWEFTGVAVLRHELTREYL